MSFGVTVDRDVHVYVYRPKRDVQPWPTTVVVEGRRIGVRERA
jgi:hypothetical protein